MRRLIFYVFLFFTCTPFINAQKWDPSYWETLFWLDYYYELESKGKFTAFYNNGYKKYEGSFDQDLPSGVWVHYSNNGRKMVEMEFTGFYKRWDLKGNLVETGQYEKGEKTGTWIQWEVLGNDTIKLSEYDVENGLYIIYHRETNSTREFELQLKEYNQDKIYPGAFHVGVNYGKHLLNFDGLTSFLVGDLLDFSLDEELRCLALDLVYNPNNKKYYSGMAWYYPETSYQITDSMGIKLHGYNILLNIGNDFVNSRGFDFAPAIGFGYSNLVFSLSSHGSSMVDSISYPDGEKFYNHNAIINFMLDIRVNIDFNKSGFDRDGMSIGLKPGYTKSVSSGKWKSKGGFKNQAPVTYLDGFYLVGIFSLFF